MAKQKRADIPKEQLAMYEKMIATHDEIEIKGASTGYTSVNGHMFSFISKEGSIGLRLSKEDREAFMKKYKTELQVQHGSVMKEYVNVPAAFFKTKKTMLKYLKMSFDYVQSLPPKATKKKKK